MIHPEHQERPIEPIKWPAPVRRVTVRWNGETWQIARERRVERMTLPASDTLPAGDQSRGFWIEAVDRAGLVRYRTVMADPLGGMELFDKGGHVHRLEHAKHNASIEILIPDLPDLSELHLVSNPHAPPRDHAGTHGAAHGATRTKLTLGTIEPSPDPAPGPGHDHGKGRTRGRR